MRKGFTLAELLVGMAILSVMTIALFEVYSSVSVANRRLDRARELTEAVRTTTEEIARGVRESGVKFSWYDEATSEPLDYGNGVVRLALNNGARYFSAQDTGYNWVPCGTAAVGSGSCFLAKEWEDAERATQQERLTSTSVTLQSLKFYVSGGAKGDGATPGKVTIVAAIDLVRSMKENPNSPGVNVQTTVAERPYNAND